MPRVSFFGGRVGEIVLGYVVLGVKKRQKIKQKQKQKQKNKQKKK